MELYIWVKIDLVLDNLRNFIYPNKPKQTNLIFSTLLVTTRFPFFLVLALFLHVIPNRWTISSSHRCEGLPGGRFWCLVYQSTAALIHRLSINFVTCLTQPNFWFWFSVTASFNQPYSQITLLLFFPEWIFPMARCLITSRCSSFFVAANYSLAYNNENITVLLTGWARRV